MLPEPEVSIVALAGSPDGPGGVPCQPQPETRKPAPETGGACWGVWWAFLGCVALIVVAVFWQRIKAGIVAGWAWVKARFRKEPK